MGAFFQSCINDGLEPCDVDNQIRVYFNYIDAERVPMRSDGIGVVRGIQLTDAEAVTQIDLYVFDANTGLFIDKFTDLSPNLEEKGLYCMIIDIPAGEYTFVAWGGMKKADFAVSPVTPVKGTSTYSDFSVNYLFHGDTISANIENLFYGARSNVRVVEADSINVDLRQDTYTFNITLTGTALREEDQYQVVITDNNSYYNFDNMRINAPSHNYKSAFSYSDQTWYTSRTTLQIDRNRKPMLRFFRNGIPWVINGMEDGIDLISLLLEYDDSIDFLNMYVFDIKFTVDGDPDDTGSISIGVEIGEWHHYVVDDPLIIL
jgi:hypothetical protein